MAFKFNPFTGTLDIAGSGGGGPATWGSITGTLADQTDLQNALNGTQASLSGFNGSLFYQVAPNDIQSIPDWSVDSISGGLFVQPIIESNNLSGNTFVTTLNAQSDPLQNSPNESVTVISSQINLDINDSGFTLGTAGRAVTMHRMGVEHQGTGDIGEISFIDSNASIGNGTDAISVRGLSYAYGFANINNNVTINGPLQGYGFQPTVDPGVTFDSSAVYVNAFYDFAYMDGVDTQGSYISFSAGPTIGSMANNSGFTGLSLNPNIDTFNGNSSFVGVSVNGILGIFDTGSFTGINVNPSITDVDNANGLYINMSNVTGTNVRAIDVVGDVAISGSLSFSGGLSIGQLSAFYGTNPVAGAGPPATLHTLITSMTALNSTTVANADAIGVNTAMIITLEADSVTTSGPFQLGFTALALPCVVATQTNATLDFMSGTTTAINLDASSTGGTIDEIRVNRSVVIPNGVTTVNKSKGFFYHEPFGGIGTNSWGIYIEDAQQNYLEAPLKIGGSDTITNNSIGLEVSAKAIRLANMDTTARNALTAVAGMMIFNTTTSALEYYDGSNWV